MAVLRSLTERGRRAFWILARHHAAHAAEHDYRGTAAIPCMHSSRQQDCGTGTI